MLRRTVWGDVSHPTGVRPHGPDPGATSGPRQNRRLAPAAQSRRRVGAAGVRRRSRRHLPGLAVRRPAGRARHGAAGRAGSPPASSARRCSTPPARTLWAVVVDRAEGRLRVDLLDAVMHQPLPALSEQAVGEVLDRVDDDTHEVGTLLRQSAWQVIRTLLGIRAAVVVAGLDLVAGLASCFPLAARRPSLAADPPAARPRSRRRKVVEEMAWTDHAAAMEEGIAARDDLRASLGQAYVVRRCTELAADGARAVRRRRRAREPDQPARRRAAARRARRHRGGRRGARRRRTGSSRPRRWSRCSWSPRRSSARSTMSPGTCPTCRPASARWSGCAGSSAPSRSPSAAASSGRRRCDVELRDLHFAYAEGRSPCSTSTSPCRPARRAPWSAAPARASRRWRPCCRAPSSRPRHGPARRRRRARPRPAAAARRAVGVVTQRTEILAGTLAENITLFADVPARRGASARSTSSASSDWVAGLPDGLDTLLGPGGTTLVRRRGAAGRLRAAAGARRPGRRARRGHRTHGPGHRGPRRRAPPSACSPAAPACWSRTGSPRPRAPTRSPCSTRGRVVQHGPRGRLAAQPGPFRRCWRRRPRTTSGTSRPAGAAAEPRRARRPPVGTARRAGHAAARRRLVDVPSLARATWRRCSSSPGGAWSAWGCSWARRCPGRSAPSPAGSGGTWSSTLQDGGQPAAAHRRAGGLPAGRRRCCWPRPSPLPAVVGRGPAARALGGAARSDRAAPARARRRPARSSPAPWTPTGSPATPTAGSTSSTGWPSSWSPARGAEPARRRCPARA